MGAYSSLAVQLKTLANLRLSLRVEQLDWLGCVQPEQLLLYDFLQLLRRHHVDIMATWAVVAEVAGELTTEALWTDRSIPGRAQVHGDGVSRRWMEMGMDRLRHWHSWSG